MVDDCADECGELGATGEGVVIVDVPSRQHKVVMHRLRDLALV